MDVTKYTVGSTYTEIAADISAVLGVQVDGEPAGSLASMAYVERGGLRQILIGVAT